MIRHTPGPPPAPVWWPVVRLFVVVVVVTGGTGLAYRWADQGYTLAAFIALAAVVGALAGLYPGDDTTNG